MTLASCSGLIVSYDRETGQRVWAYDVKVDGEAQTFHGEMARRDNALFVPADGHGGHVYRLDALTGDVVWKWRADAGVSSDITLLDDLVIFVTDDNRLTTLDIDAGVALWRSESTGDGRVDADVAPVKPTPALLGSKLLFGRSDGRVTGYDPYDPQPVWETWLPAGVSTDLTVSDDGVILGTVNGSVHRLDGEGNVVGRAVVGATPTYRWMVIEDQVIGFTGVSGPDRELVALDARTLEARWQLRSPDLEGWTTAQPASAWGLVLVGNGEPALYAVDPRTGTVRWRARTEHPPRTVAVDGDTLFIGTFGGTLNVYRKPRG